VTVDPDMSLSNPFPPGPPPELGVFDPAPPAPPPPPEKYCGYTPFE